MDRRGGALRVRRRSPFRWWLPLVCLVVLAYGIGGWFFAGTLLKGPLAQAMGDLFDTEVAIGFVRFNPLTLELDLRDVGIAGRDQQSDQPPLLRASSLTGRIAFAGLLQGEILCGQTVLTEPVLTVTRNGQGEDNVPAGVKAMLAAGRGLALPSWIRLERLEIRKGSLRFIDRKTDWQRQFQGIDCILPLRAGFQDRPDVQLTFSLGGVPVRLGRVERLVEQGRERLRLRLTAEGLTLKALAGLIPGWPESIEVVGGTAGATLSLSWSTDQMQPSLETGLGVQVRDGLLRAAPGYALQVSQADLVLAGGEDGAGLRLQKLKALGPELVLPQGLEWNLELLRSSLKRLSPFFIAGSMPETLELDQGRIVREETDAEGGDLLARELFLSLDAGKSGGEQHRLALHWKGEESEVSFSGELGPDFALRGEAEVETGDINRFPLSLAGGMRKLINRGEAAFNGRIAWRPLESDSDVQVEAGTLKVSRFAVADQGEALISGKEMVCSGVNGQGCARLEFQESTLESGLWKRALPGKAGHSLLAPIGAVRFTNGILRMAPRLDNAGALLPIELKEVDFQYGKARDGAEGDGNFSLQGSLGEKGKVQVVGRLVPEGESELELTGKGIALQETQKVADVLLALKINSGAMDVQGRLTLPGQAFAGDIALLEVHAAGKANLDIRIPMLKAKGVRSRMAPFALTVGNIQAENCSIAADRWSLDVPALVFRPPPAEGQGGLAIERLEVSNASWQATGGALVEAYRPQWKGNLLITGLDGNGFDFSSELAAGKGKLVAEGRSSLTALLNYRIQVQGFALGEFQSFFRQYGLDTSKAVAGWQLAGVVADGEAAETGKVRLKGLRGSEPAMASLLQVLEEKGRGITLELDGQRGVRLFERVGRHLQRERVKGEISRDLVLDQAVPKDLRTTRISFIPGRDVPEDTQLLADLAFLLEERPGLRVTIRPGYGGGDGDAVRAVLQEEANAQAALEAARIEKQRAELLRKGDLAALELLDALQAPAAKKVKLPNDALEQLALRRAEVVSRILEQELGIPRARMVIDTSIASQGPFVDLQPAPAGP